MVHNVTQLGAGRREARVGGVNLEGREGTWGMGGHGEWGMENGTGIAKREGECEGGVDV